MSAIRALLVTDIVDSTRLLAQLGDAAAAALWSAHDRAARDLLQAWQGLEIDRTDGFLLMFEHAADALGYARAYHRALTALAVPLRARVGLHVGPVLLRPNSPADIGRGAKPLEVEGLAKPVAARVMAIAQGDQTLLSAQARDALGPAEPALRSFGHWRIKGLDTPLELFDGGDDQAPCAPPPDSEKAYRVVRKGDLWLPVRAVRHSLPAERDVFVGREAPLRELAQRFDSGARLVSVLGTGGTGKTRLATRFGWRWLGDFAGGVWFCDLSQARTLDGIARAVALGLDVPLGSGDSIARLGAAIAGRGHCLVILDNFEQVSRHADETLGRWLDTAHEARFLVTTREVLGLPGEQTHALAPLPGAQAAELFMQRALAARHDLALTAEDLAAIDPLMQLLDGLPLAIELAAARVRVMPPRMLLQRMSERFRLLASAGGRQDRQATLRATLDWSWELLSPADQAALAQLSVFEGGFTLAAAETVLDLSGFSDAPWPIDTLSSLVDKSLVRALANARFDLLVSIQDYAAEHLQTPGRFTGSGAAARRAAEARHFTYFAAFGEARAIAEGCADLDNLVTACRRAVAHGAAPRAADALEGAWAALGFRGPLSAGIELAAAVLSMTALTSVARAQAEIVAGHALDALGEPTEAAQHFEAGLALARAAGDRRCEARACVGLGYLGLHAGQVDEARSALTRARSLAREIGDLVAECAALNGLGNLSDALGEPATARAHYEAALTLARAAGDRHWEGSVLGNLGGVHEGLGQLAEASRQLEASLEVARELGDRQREGNALCNLGWIHYRQGQLERAREQSASALIVARDLGHARLECIVLCNLGVVHEAAGRADDAQYQFALALALARRLGDRRSEGQVLTYLGVLQARQLDFTAAHASLDTAEMLLQEVADRHGLGMLLCGRAETHDLAGAHAEAANALRAAETLAEAIGAEPASEFGESLARVQRRVERRPSL